MHPEFTTARSRQRLRPLAEMNVTSLVDVVLVLLIIFMLTAPFIQGGIEVDLPQANTPATAAIEGPVISVDTQRRIFIDEDQVPMTRLAEVLREIRPPGSDTPVYLRSDEGVPYGFVVRVMGEIKEGGVDDLSLVVEPDGQGGS
ncbi:protein TolR [bacterium]|nr:MAG: protein TolR [bacterium]RKZ18213.1 MAG: protein TolR [bacterium]